MQYNHCAGFRTLLIKYKLGGQFNKNRVIGVRPGTSNLENDKYFSKPAQQAIYP